MPTPRPRCSRASASRHDVRGIAVATGWVLGVAEPHIELGERRAAETDEQAFDLLVGDRYVGRLFAERRVHVDPSVADRVLPGLASLFAAAIDRERLAQRALEAETLRRSDAAKTAILRSVSHDLRSPLTTIRASTEALTNQALELSDSDRAELLESVASESMRLSRLVDDLLDLSRLEAGAAPPVLELWTLEDLVGRTLADLGPVSERVRVTVPAELPPVRVDGAQIERVLANLLENALKFSSSADPVELQAALEDDDLVVRVVDSGPGLTDAELGRIFEPFEHGDSEPARRGAGLGLAIARGFAQANGGILWAERRSPRGSAFVLSLPTAGARLEART